MEISAVLEFSKDPYDMAALFVGQISHIREHYLEGKFPVEDLNQYKKMEFRRKAGK